MSEFVIVVQNGLIVDGYPHSIGDLGYLLEDLVSKPLTDLVPAEERDQVARFLKMIADGGVPGSRREIRIIGADGQIHWLDVRSAPVSWEGNKAVIMLGHEITECKHLEERLQERIADREIMLKEVHHRVKNNMQVIASLLSLQAQNVKDDETASMFRDSQARIRAMALIHEVLYQSDTFTRIHMDRYLNQLAETIVRGYGAHGQTIRVEAAIDPIVLGLDQAIPIGLAVNEIIMNSVKHAFPAGQTGTIEIRSRILPEDWLELLVRDDGVGLMDEDQMDRAGSLGIPLVYNLVERQLSGRITVDHDNGTAFRIAFKVKEENNGA